MIYRIAIYKNGKFDHHATQEERYWLRINSSGLVQKVKNGLSQLFSGWFDVSKTHKVEWGIEFNGVKFFDQDILETTVNGKKIILIMRHDNYIGSMWMEGKSDPYDIGVYCPGFEETFRVIGNVHQNPELLEEK